MDSIFARIYDSLRSLKLAVGLIILLGLLAVIGGLLPQGADPGAYASQFPAMVSGAILALSLDTVFTSPVFLLAAALFSVNLTLCSFHRLVGQLAKPFKTRRHGPDILHIGLILLIVGSTWSARVSSETTVQLSVGSETPLPGGEILRLSNFSFEHYPDGRPKLWRSIVEIDASGETKVSGFDLRVNHPLRFGGYTFYQSGYSEVPTLVLRRGALGLPESLVQGDRLETDDGFVLFMAIDPVPSANESGYIFLVDGKSGRKVLKASLGESIGPFTLSSKDQVYSSSIKVKRDPAFPLILAGLILVALGTILTYIVKLREQQP
ncbi:MAG: hypothetical protein A2Y38_05415 [Spirochaetes bacterium GWB1_59_5]|nr:MAG: hypothetical protein A2Y38_05415 [Spirochaetes bacterium GWB1_59_5]